MWLAGDPGPLDHIKQSGEPPGSCLPCTTFIAANRTWPLQEVFKRRDEILASFPPGRWSKVFPFTILY